MCFVETTSKEIIAARTLATGNIEVAIFDDEASSRVGTSIAGVILTPEQRDQLVTELQR